MAAGSRSRALRRALAAAVAAGLIAWIAWIARLADEPVAMPGLAETAPAAGPAGRPGRPGSPGPPAAPLAMTTDLECEPCHREIYGEWFEDQHALAWFNQPLLPQDPKLIECNNCHAPQPVLELPEGELPRIRSDRYEEGVGCLECHANRDHVEGPRSSADAPCNPRQEPRFDDASICSPCHAAHGTYAEWRGSAWAARGVTCQSCHMPLVDAPVVTGGPAVRRRSHRMLSQRDPEHLRSALALETEIVAGRTLRVSVTNVGAGHNVPGEISNREVFLLTEVFDGSGARVGGHRESFQTVRRPQRATEPSTQIRPGERREFSYDLGPSGGKVTVALGYKLLGYIPDDRACLIEEKTLEF